MRFFTIEQDKSLPDMIEFSDFDICGPRHIFHKKDAGRIRSSTALYLTEKSGECAPDFIQSPIPMVSDTVKKVLDIYEDGMIFKSVPIISMEREKILKYHTLLLDGMDMLSGKSEFYANGSVRRLVLDAAKVGEHHVFLLDDRRFRNPFVSLEVMESLLRRNVTGIVWTEVEVE